MQAMCRIAAREPMEGLYPQGNARRDTQSDQIRLYARLGVTMYELWRVPTARERAWPVMHAPRLLNHPVVTRLLLPSSRRRWRGRQLASASHSPFRSFETCCRGTRRSFLFFLDTPFLYLIFWRIRWTGPPQGTARKPLGIRMSAMGIYPLHMSVYARSAHHRPHRFAHLAGQGSRLHAKPLTWGLQPFDRVPPHAFL